MPSLVNFFFALGSLSSLALAVPVREEPEQTSPLCLAENPIVAALGAEASATAFCSSYFKIATETFSATTTVETSTSTTTTVLDGTQIITDPTVTSTEVSAVTTTAVVFTTSDDTAAPTIAKRAACVSVPDALTKFKATALSSACSCLSIPTPSVTNTETVTSTVSLTLTASTFAATTTTTPVEDTATTTTDTVTSTSTILKSDVLATIVALVDEQPEYQTFCSNILTYTTPVITAYETTTTTTAVTASSTTTVYSYTTVTTTVIQQGAAKRQEPTASATPDALATFPADYVTSACSAAVTSPAAATTTSTATVTETQTSVEVATVTAEATSTVTKTCLASPISNSGFEGANFNGWTVYNPIGGSGGAWSIVSGGGYSSSSYSAQITMLNPDTSKYGGFGGYLMQTINVCAGSTYTVSFQYDCTLVNNGLAIWATGGGSSPGQFACASSGSWNTVSWSFTASDVTASILIEGVQNGLTRGTILFDNIVVTLNQ